MVAHKNRYLVFEIFLDPNRESGKEDDVVLNQFSIMKAIHDSLLINFGEHGLASCVGYLQGNLKGFFNWKICFFFVFIKNLFIQDVNDAIILCS
jgi:ribonuclease P/MRP protein subunit POP5